MIADSTKPVDRIGAPIPLELAAYGLASTLRRLGDEVGPVEIRPDTPPSPDGGVIADLSATSRTRPGSPPLWSPFRVSWTMGSSRPRWSPR